jgi:hypothetical protein
MGLCARAKVQEAERAMMVVMIMVMVMGAGRGPGVTRGAWAWEGAGWTGAELRAPSAAPGNQQTKGATLARFVARARGAVPGPGSD